MRGIDWEDLWPYGLVGVLAWGVAEAAEVNAAGAIVIVALSVVLFRAGFLAAVRRPD